MANGCVAAIRKGCELYGQVKGTVAEAKKTVADVQKTVNDVKNIASEVGGFFGWFKKKPKPSEAQVVEHPENIAIKNIAVTITNSIVLILCCFSTFLILVPQPLCYALQ